MGSNRGLSIRSQRFVSRVAMARNLLHFAFNRNGIVRCLSWNSDSALSLRARIGGDIRSISSFRVSSSFSPLSSSSSSRRKNWNTQSASSSAIEASASVKEDLERQIGEDRSKSRSSAYPFSEIEAKWQAHWEEHQTFRTPEFHELDTSKPKFYALDMFPYPR